MNHKKTNMPNFPVSSFNTQPKINQSISPPSLAPSIHFPYTLSPNSLFISGVLTDDFGKRMFFGFCSGQTTVLILGYETINLLVKEAIYSFD